MKKLLKPIVIVLVFLTCLIIGLLLEHQEHKSYSGWESDFLEKSTLKDTASFKINLNTASVYQLSRLSGIGEETARKIIDYRKENGKFEVIEDVMKINGFGRKSFEKIKSRITV